MKGFNWEKFAKADSKFAVHCDTKAKARNFLKEAHEHGFKWNEGQSLLEQSYYGNHEKNTCYSCYSGTLAYYKSFSLTYSGILYFEENHYKIIEWEIDEMKKFTEKDIKVGMLVKNKYYDTYETLGYGMVMPSKRNGIAIVHKDETWEDIDFSDITEVWGYCEFAYGALKFDSDGRELLYKRNEVKKMTVKEICELVGFDVEIVKE